MFLIVIMVVGLMVVFEIGSIFKSDEEVIGALKILQSKEYAYALLETPVNLDGGKITFSDLVVKSFEEEGGDYSELKDFFNEEFSDTSLYWYIGIDDFFSDAANPTKKISRSNWQRKWGVNSIAQEIVIPSYSGNPILLKVNIVEGREIPDYDSYGTYGYGGY